MTKKQKRILLALSILLILAVIFIAAFDTELAVRTYQVESNKVTAPVRIALLTDLHSCDYGEGQQALIGAVEAQNPDIVLLGGDIIDDDARLPEENALTVVRWLSARYPTYYVSGNHEFWTKEIDAVKERLSACGVTILAGDCATVEVQGQTLQVCGIDDPSVGEDAWRGQLYQVGAAVEEESFSILLSHRPERIDDYTSYPFDLILSGHAHGGQWRLPGLINGLIAPNQGLFPKYAGGRYDLEGHTFIVSRGLARESTRVPRIFNPPELVVINIVVE